MKRVERIFEAWKKLEAAWDAGKSLHPDSDLPRFEKADRKAAVCELRLGNLLDAAEAYIVDDKWIAVRSGNGATVYKLVDVRPKSEG